jgi:hypothetical protein
LEIAFGTAEAVPFQSDFPALKALANSIRRLSMFLTHPCKLPSFGYRFG